MRKLIVAALTLLLLPAPLAAQDSVPDAPSLKEIRQRAGFALSRADNLTEEIAAAIAHLERLRAMADSAVVRDSLLGERPADTVRVGTTDSVPPAPPSRPISFDRRDSISVEVRWPSADGARWYNWGSSAGGGFGSDTTTVLDLQAGDWFCLWAANGAGRAPATDGVCTSVDSASVATAPDTTATDTTLTVDTQDIVVSPDSVQIQVGDTAYLYAANLIRRGDSIVGCVGACGPYVDSIRPAVWRDSTAYWIGAPQDPDAPSHIWGLHPMSVLDSIIAERSAT